MMPLCETYPTISDAVLTHDVRIPIAAFSPSIIEVMSDNASGLHISPSSLHPRSDVDSQPLPSTSQELQRHRANRFHKRIKDEKARFVVEVNSHPPNIQPDFWASLNGRSPTSPQIIEAALHYA